MGFKYPIDGTVTVTVPDNFVSTTSPDPATPGYTEGVFITTKQGEAGNVSPLVAFGIGHVRADRLITLQNLNLTNVSSVNVSIAINNGYSNTLFKQSTNVPSNTQYQDIINLWNFWGNTAPGSPVPTSLTPAPATTELNARKHGSVRMRFQDPATGNKIEETIIDATLGTSNSSGFVTYSVPVNPLYQKDGIDVQLFQGFNAQVASPLTTSVPLSGLTITPNLFPATMPTTNLLPTPNPAASGPTAAVLTAYPYLTRRATTEFWRVGYQFVEAGSLKMPFHGVSSVRLLNDGTAIPPLTEPLSPLQVIEDEKVRDNVIRFSKGPSAGDHGVTKFSWDPANSSAFEVQANVAAFNAQDVTFTSNDIDPDDEMNARYFGNQNRVWHYDNRPTAMKGTFAALNTLAHAPPSRRGSSISVHQRLRFASEVVDTIGSINDNVYGSKYMMMGFNPNYGPAAAVAMPAPLLLLFPGNPVKYKAFPGRREEIAWGTGHTYGTYAPRSSPVITGFPSTDFPNIWSAPPAGSNLTAPSYYYPHTANTVPYQAPGGVMGSAMPLALGANGAGSSYYQDGVLNFEASYYGGYSYDAPTPAPPAVVQTSGKVSKSGFNSNSEEPHEGWYLVPDIDTNGFGDVWGRYQADAFGSSPTHGFVFSAVGLWGAPTPHVTINTDPRLAPFIPIAIDIPTGNRIRSNAYRFPFSSYFEIREFANGVTTQVGGGTVSSQEAMYVLGGHGPAAFTTSRAQSLIYAGADIGINTIQKVPFSVGAPGQLASPGTLSTTMSRSGGTTDGYSGYIFNGVNGVTYSAPLLGTVTGDAYYYTDYAPYTDPTPTPTGGIPTAGITIWGRRRVDRLPYAADTASSDFGDIDPATYAAGVIQAAASPTNAYISVNWDFGVPGTSGISGMTTSSILKFPFQAATTIAGFASAISTPSPTVARGVSYSQSEFNSYGTGSKFNFITEIETAQLGYFNLPFELRSSPGIFNSPTEFDYAAPLYYAGFGGINQ